MKNSIIKRVPNCYYFQIAEDYQALCVQEKNGKLTPNDCAAAVLSLFENLVNSRIIARAKNPLSFPASTNYIRKCLLNHYSNNSILEAISFLDNESYISIKRTKTDKNNNLPNEITLNTEHINYMLNEYCKIKVVQNCVTPYSKLNNPLCKIEQGGYSKLHTELSIKKQVLEINKETLSISENPIFISTPENQKEKEEKGGRLPNTTNELSYTAFSDVVRNAIKIDSIDKRNQYITNLGVKPSNTEAANILEAIVKNYIAIRFKNVCEFPYLNTDERAQDWAVKRCTFADFNAYTLSQISIQQAQSMNGANRKPVNQKEQTTDDKNKRLLELLKKNGKL